MTAPVVRTKSGPVAGTVTEKGIVAFRGIPYAQPPIGPLRFRPPEPVTPWEETLDARRFGDASVQIYMPEMDRLGDFYDEPPAETPSTVGNEDCLTLNVWTPALDGERRPVYIWIHGGANHLESSRLPTYHGDNLCAAGDIVVASLNYRLGAFGFMDVEPVLGPDYRGAYTNGLKDQFLALEWLKANIAAFGGDPDNITVAGESAGGMDVSWLLCSGRLKGLVKRAVVMSNVVGPSGLGGDGPRYRHSPETVREISMDVIGRAGLNAGDTLLTSDAHEIVGRIGALEFDHELFGLDGQLYPGLDGDICPMEPLAAIDAGAMDGIDLIIGYTNFEAGLWLLWLPHLIDMPPDWTAERFGFLSPETQAEAVAAYARFHPDETPGVQGLQMVSDNGFTVPTTIFAEHVAARGSNVWMYRCDYEVNDVQRAMHAVDLPFWFAEPEEPPHQRMIAPPRSAADEACFARLRDEMAGSLINFVREGTPRAEGLPHWPQFVPGEAETMIFGSETRVEANPLGEKLDFWKTTFLPRFSGANKEAAE